MLFQLPGIVFARNKRAAEQADCKWKSLLAHNLPLEVSSAIYDKFVSFRGTWNCSMYGIAARWFDADSAVPCQQIGFAHTRSMKWLGPLLACEH